ncbi:Uncharacterized protein ACO02O_06751 [Dirofilaria immitis]
MQKQRKGLYSQIHPNVQACKILNPTLSRALKKHFLTLTVLVNMYEVIIFLLLLTQQIGNARKVGGGGVNRGSSAARMKMNVPRINSPSLARGSHSQQTNYHPQQSNYHSQQNDYRANLNGHQQSGGYYSNPIAGHHQQEGFVSSKMKPSNTGTFKKAVLGGLLGSVAGVATFELGKAILHSGSESLRTSNGQNYYFDEGNYRSKNGYFMCSMPISDIAKALQENSTAMPDTDESKNSTAMTLEQFFKTVQFQDGSRPKSLTWSCMIGTEVCCGIECCNSAHHKRPSSNIFVSILVLLVPFFY